MATNTYVALDKVTVGTATSSITFSSIPQGYTDLVLVLSAATTHTLSTFPMVQFNGDTATNYSVTELYGTGSAAGSARDTNTSSGWIGFDIAMSTTVGEHTTIANFMNYSNTTTYKTWLSRANRASSALDYQGTDAVVGLWRSTAAITSITVKNRRGGVDYNFAVGTTASLYGIKALTVPGTAKATGGTITYDAFGNVYHTFTSSGTFTPSVALSCDYLVIAGGGGGGQFGPGGGGGGGGYRTGTGLAVSATGYSITVGAGGGTGSVGSNSIFSSITSTGGGQGGSSFDPGGAGGSGGGGGAGGGAAGAASPAGQGNAGGSGDGSSSNYSGGGGGAGSAGGRPDAGGPITSTFTGTSISRAGGGSGGAGGNFGGGAGSASTTVGGGGGGAGSSGGQVATAGQAGIVIIKYAG